MFRLLWGNFHQSTPRQLRQYVQEAPEDTLDDLIRNQDTRERKIAKLAYTYHATRAFLEEDPQIVNKGTYLMTRIWDINVDDDQNMEKDAWLLKEIMLRIFGTKLFKKAITSHFQALGIFLSPKELSRMIGLCQGLTITPLKLIGEDFLTGFVLPDGIGIFLRYLEKKNKSQDRERIENLQEDQQNSLDNRAILARCLIVGLHETAHFLIRNQNVTQCSFSDETPSHQIGEEARDDLHDLEGGKLFEYIVFGTYNHEIWENKDLTNKLLEMINWSKLPPLLTRKEITQAQVFDGNFWRSAVYPLEFFPDELDDEPK